MHVKVDADERKQVYVHYVSTPVPFVVEENYEEYYNIEDDDVVQVLHDQETLIRSFANSIVTNQDQTQGREQQNQSETITDQSQLLIDEALARCLQELEFSSTSINECTMTGPDSSSNGSSSRSGEGSSTGSATPELQTLADVVGSESKALSDDLISYSPTSTYKVGLFSKKNRGDNCVICLTDYEHRDRLTNLTCQHQYHSTCITTWLKISKTCPICKEEVFGA